MGIYMLTTREQSVLEAVVREYITSAAPVSSDVVVQKAAIGASSATARSIMMDLEEAGYLLQPHTSAGRCPTQKGYRFFVDNCAYSEVMPRSVQTRMASMADRDGALRFTTTHTRLFTAVVNIQTGASYRFGLGKVLQEPEFSDTERLQMFGTFMDSIDTIPAYYRDNMDGDNDLTVFIERENPIPSARMLSVVAALMQDDASMLFVIGPSRMDYGRVMALMRTVISVY
jgi:transcriptional regulator of heat shock response